MNQSIDKKQKQFDNIDMHNQAYLVKSECVIDKICDLRLSNNILNKSSFHLTPITHCVFRIWFEKHKTHQRSIQILAKTLTKSLLKPAIQMIKKDADDERDISKFEKVMFKLDKRLRR